MVGFRGRGQDKGGQTSKSDKQDRKIAHGFKSFFARPSSGAAALDRDVLLAAG